MGKFIIQLIEKKHFNRWDELVKKRGSIFQTISWTEIFEPEIARIGIFEKGGDLIGGFILWERSGWVYRNPYYTPFIGPFFEVKAQKKFFRMKREREILSTMVEYLESKKYLLITLQLDPRIRDIFPFFWQNYKVITQYTYRINLKRSKEVILNEMSPERKRNIKKAIKYGINIIESKNTMILKDLVEKSFKRQRKRYPKLTMEKILKKFPPGDGNSVFLVALYKDKPVASIYMVYDDKIAYNLIPAHDHEYAYTGAGALVAYEAILTAQRIGLEYFDFEGSMVPSIERFFRGFGGDLIPYFRVNKAWLPLEIILKFFKRQFF